MGDAGQRGGSVKNSDTRGEHLDIQDIRKENFVKNRTWR